MNKPQERPKSSVPKPPLYTYAVLEDPNLGARKTMEDYTIAEPKLTSDGRWGLFVILDGHGGNKIADETKKSYPKILAGLLSQQKNLANLKETIAKSIEQLSEKLSVFKETECGTTFCGLLIDSFQSRYFVINIGDSSLVRIRSAGKGNKLDMQCLTSEHKVTNPKERERIKAVDGLLNNRVGGQLLVTRAIGDFSFQLYGLISTPDISEFSIEREKYLLIGSDGVWDVVDSEQTRILIESNFDKSVNELVAIFVEDAKTKSIDNISLIGIKF